MTLDDWNAVLQVGSAILLGVTFAIGGGAIMTGIWVSKRQSAEIAAAKASAAEAGERAAAANERAGKLELQAAEQRERAAKAERELFELRERLKPRALTDSQRTALITSLKAASAKGAVEITCVLGDGEGFAFASQIDNALKEGGWSTSGVNQSVYGSGGNPVGIGIVVSSVAAAPPYAKALQQAFKTARIPLALLELAGPKAGEVVIVVGNKP